MASETPPFFLSSPTSVREEMTATFHRAKTRDADLSEQFCLHRRPHCLPLLS